MGKQFYSTFDRLYQAGSDQEKKDHPKYFQQRESNIRIAFRDDRRAEKPKMASKQTVGSFITPKLEGKGCDIPKAQSGQGQLAEAKTPQASLMGAEVTRYMLSMSRRR
jgi:hypothetical protein